MLSIYPVIVINQIESHPLIGISIYQSVYILLFLIK